MDSTPDQKASPKRGGKPEHLMRRHAYRVSFDDVGQAKLERGAGTCDRKKIKAYIEASVQSGGRDGPIVPPVNRVIALRLGTLHDAIRGLDRQFEAAGRLPVMGVRQLRELLGEMEAAVRQWGRMFLGGGDGGDLPTS